MSQPRIHKVPVAGGGNGSRPRASVVKASGDNVPCNTGPKQQNQRSTSKNKVPKSIRYDLENALVGLCDVWFEDIKPHLIRNNIKLHLHGAGPGPAGGDHENVPPGAPGCSHLDPGAASDQRRRSGASCADCYSTLQTVSKVQCHRPQAHQCLSPPFPVLPSSLQIPLPHATPNNCGCNDKRKPLSRRKSQHPQSLSQQAYWRVPRLCRTYSTLSPTCTARTQTRRLHTALQPQHIPRDGDFFIQPRHKVKIKHKSTQTESPSRLSRPFCPPRLTSPMPTTFGRCPGTTTIPHRQRSPGGNCRQYRCTAKPLFAKDLVNIIAEKHDKKIRLLYKSPQREEYPSVMNLILSPKDSVQDLASVGKKKPWR